MRSTSQTPVERRAGDAERIAASETLSDALVTGQLSQPEFDERTSAAFEARTRSELVALTADLVDPADTPRVERRPASPVVVSLPVGWVKGVGFAGVLGVLAFLIAQMMFGFTLESDSHWFAFFIWLFGLSCGGVGSLLTSKRREH